MTYKPPDSPLKPDDCDYNKDLKQHIKTNNHEKPNINTTSNFQPATCN